METHSVDFNALGLGFNSYVCKAKGKEGGGDSERKQCRATGGERRIHAKRNPGFCSMDSVLVMKV